jgi:hypothetical protein
MYLNGLMLNSIGSIYRSYKVPDVYVPAEDGSWVSEEFARLAEVVKDYDHNLELRWVPPDKRTRDDKKPYCIVDTRTLTVVFYASELDTPTDILARLFAGDNVRNGNVLQTLETWERARKTLETKKFLEELEEGNDIASSMIDSSLNVYRHNGKKFDDQRRVIGPAVDRKHL